MSGAGRSGPHESADRAQPRRGGGWAQLGRRGGSEPEPVVPFAGPGLGDSELRPVAVRTPEPAADEHHLGERLSAFVDGELGHDSRDRVQAHLATCRQCLAEADEGRAVKHLLTHTGTPAPSSALMARLLAVGALGDRQGDGEQPDDGDRPAGPAARRRRDDDADDQHGGGGPGGPGAGPLAAVSGTLGGSRLTGGSFGRGAGSSFGGGALGAGAPLPGVDPRAFGRGSVLRPLMGRRGPQAAAQRPPAPEAPATAVRASQGASEPVQRQTPRPRRFVFAAAAAGAFSVAAVTLGGVGGVSSPAEGDRHGTAVTPARGPVGGAAQVSVSGQVPVDFPAAQVAATRSAALPDGPGRFPGADSPYGGAPYSGAPSGGQSYGGQSYGGQSYGGQPDGTAPHSAAPYPGGTYGTDLSGGGR